MGNILVIGGTGNMGRPLVKSLAEDGHSVFAVCRKKVGEEDVERLARNGGGYFYGDAKDKQFMGEVLNRHYDAIVDFCIYSSAEFRERMNVFLDKTDQYVCLSTAAVYADIPTPKNESSPRYMEVDPPREGTARWGWYCYEKARIEDMLFASGRRNWTIVRPGITMNANHIGWNLWWDDDWVGRIIQGRKILIEKEVLDFKFSLSSGEQVAFLIGAVIGNSRAKGEVFNVCSQEVWTWKDMLDTYARIFLKYGYKLRITYVKSQDVIRMSPGYEYWYRRARLLDRVFDNAKIRSIIHVWPSSVGMEELLEEWTDSFIRKYKPHAVPLEHLVFMDRLTGDCSPRRNFCSSRQYFRYLVMRYCSKIIRFYSFIRGVGAHRM